MKLVKVQGEFVFHHHETKDELFLVLQGRLMRYRDPEVWVGAGECVIVPHGVERCPAAPEEVHLLLLEPATTLNTGTERNERTAAAQWI